MDILTYAAGRLLLLRQHVDVGLGKKIGLPDA
jgi:hypothetical protein